MAVGSNGQVLTASSSATFGVAWGPDAGGGTIYISTSSAGDYAAGNLAFFVSTSTLSASSSINFTSSTGRLSLQAVSSTSLFSTSFQNTGQSNLATVSSTNLLATGYLNVSGRSDFTLVSSTALFATSFQNTGRSDLTAVTSTNLQATGYIRGDSGLNITSGQTSLQSVTSTNIMSSGDIWFDGEIKPDGATCSNGQILKKTGASDWDCAADATGGAGGAANEAFQCLLTPAEAVLASTTFAGPAKRETANITATTPDWSTLRGR